ncbi:MAG TPA: LPS assembly lipoprotein LptE [Vicinamibacteria bacterium]
MRSARLVVLGSVLVSMLGCGYSLVGRGITTDPSIKRIGVPLFKDRTGKLGLDQQVTQKVTEELLRRGRFDVVPQATGVDALVEGEVVSYSVLPIGFGDVAVTTGTQTQASRYAITLVARVKYTKVGQAEPIWQSESFSFRDEYDVGDNPANFFDREDQTIERMSSSFAKNLVSAMLEAF